MFLHPIDEDGLRGRNVISGWPQSQDSFEQKIKECLTNSE
jgi:hypothetical protein